MSLETYKQIRYGGREARQHGSFQRIGDSKQANSGRRLNEDFAVFIVELPNFLAARSEVLERLGVDVDRAFGGGDHFDGDIGGAGQGDLFAVDAVEPVEKKNGNIRPTHRSGSGKAIHFAEGHPNRALREVVSQYAFNVVTNFGVQGRSTGQSDQFSVYQFKVRSLWSGHPGEFFDGHQRACAHACSTSIVARRFAEYWGQNDDITVVTVRRSAC